MSELGDPRHPLPEHSPIETVATFFAHYDDDLIFANPTLTQALESGCRTRSFFFTAGDAGKGMSEYVAGREQGIRAAYDTMLGRSGAWTDRAETLGNGLRVTVTSPDDDDRVALIFLRLADGGLSGNGYEATGRNSLRNLFTGYKSPIRGLDSDQDITLELLRGAVMELIAQYRPTLVITNNPTFADGADGDHPDHQTVGSLVASLVDDGLVDARLVRYAVGYPAAERPANIESDALRRKLEVFAAYAADDPVVARAQPEEYLAVRGFGDWLQRQYLVPHDELVRVGTTR